MLSEPQLTLKDIGARLGRSPAWMTGVVHTEMFRDMYMERRRERNTLTNIELSEALGRVAKLGLEVLEKKLENTAGIAPKLALEIVDTTLERLGYGSSPLLQVNNNTQNNVVLSPEDFAHAQNIVRQIETGDVGLRKAPEAPTGGALTIDGAVLSPPQEPDLDALLNSMLPSAGNVDGETFGEEE